MGTPAEGWEALAGVGATAPSTQSIIILNESVKRLDTHYHSDGLVGTRKKFKDRVRKVQTAVSGSLLMEPGPTEIDWFLPRILGGSTGGGVTDVADTLPEWVLDIERATAAFRYSGCRVSKATFSGAAGQMIRLQIDVEAEEEDDTITFPSLTLPSDNGYILADCTLTLGGSTREFESFNLVIDNLLDTGRYMNSVTRTEIPAQNRDVSLSVVLPYTSDNADLYDAAIAGAVGSLVLDDGSSGGDVYTFDFGNVKIPAESPVVGGKVETKLNINAKCFAVQGGASECKVTKT